MLRFFRITISPTVFWVPILQKRHHEIIVSYWSYHIYKFSNTHIDEVNEHQHWHLNKAHLYGRGTADLYPKIRAIPKILIRFFFKCLHLHGPFPYPPLPQPPKNWTLISKDHLSSHFWLKTQSDPSTPHEKPHSVHIRTLEPKMHPSDFHSMHEIHPLKSIVWSEDTL